MRYVESKNSRHSLFRSSKNKTRFCKYNMVFFLTRIHLQSIFDWNVKQLFLYLSAEYSTKNNVSIKKKVEAITHFVLQLFLTF